MGKKKGTVNVPFLMCLVTQTSSNVCLASTTIFSVVSQQPIEVKSALHLVVAPTPVEDKQVVYAFHTVGANQVCPLASSSKLESVEANPRCFSSASLLALEFWLEGMTTCFSTMSCRAG
jgi:hypothetical protein